jgi:hypothetical protein
MKLGYLFVYSTTRYLSVHSVYLFWHVFCRRYLQFIWLFAFHRRNSVPVFRPPSLRTHFPDCSVSTSLINLVIFRGKCLWRRTVLGTWMYYFTHSWYGHVKDSSGPVCLPAALTPAECPSYSAWSPTFFQVLEKMRISFFCQKSDHDFWLLPFLLTLAHSIPAKSGSFHSC